MLHLFAPLFICLQELDKTCSTSLHQPSSGQLDEPVWVNICTAVGVVFVFRAALDKLLSGTVWEWTEKKVLGGCIYEGRECVRTALLPSGFAGAFFIIPAYWEVYCHTQSLLAHAFGFSSFCALGVTAHRFLTAAIAFDWHCASPYLDGCPPQRSERHSPPPAELDPSARLAAHVTDLILLQTAAQDRASESAKKTIPTPTGGAWDEYNRSQPILIQEAGKLVCSRDLGRGVEYLRKRVSKVPKKKRREGVYKAEKEILLLLQLEVMARGLPTEQWTEGEATDTPPLPLSTLLSAVPSFAHACALLKIQPDTALKCTLRAHLQNLEVLRVERKVLDGVLDAVLAWKNLREDSRERRLAVEVCM